jgi:hypothetical protein
MQNPTKLCITTLLFVFAHSNGFAMTNKEIIRSCQTIGTIWSATAAASNWDAEAVKNIDNLNERFMRYALKEHGSAAAVKAYNEAAGMQFARTVMQMPEQKKIDAFLECKGWTP